MSRRSWRPPARRPLRIGFRGVLAAAALCVLIAVGAACGDSEPGVITQALAPERCRPVSADELRSIAVGLTRGPRRLSDGAMVESESHPGVRVIAGRFTADNIPDDQVAVWARVAEPGGAVRTVAVDRVARFFSRWPAGNDAEGTGLISDGVADARACSLDGGA